MKLMEATLNGEQERGLAKTLSTMAITEASLAKINLQTLTIHQIDELFAFQVLLIDDQITRNNTQYPESFQRTILNNEPRKGNWIGLTFLMGTNSDHETMARNQVARIYDAHLVKTPSGNTGTMAEAFIPINKYTEELISDIKAGIHREVSIGVSVEQPLCSICNQDIRSCEHIPGESYQGRLAFVKMSGGAEAYEVSFVAVPGSMSAQIMSSTEGYVSMKECLNTPLKKKEAQAMKPEFKEAMKQTILSLGKETLADNATDDAIMEAFIKSSEAIRTLQAEAMFGKVYRGELVSETVRLGLLAKAIPIESQETFKSTFETMSVEQVKAFQSGYKSQVETMYPPTGTAVALTENKEEVKQVQTLSTSDIVNQFKSKGAR